MGSVGPLIVALTVSLQVPDGPAPKKAAGGPPRVRSATPPAESPASKGKEGDASAFVVKKGPPAASRVAFWRDYYRTHDETTRDVLNAVLMLRADGDMTDVEAVLGGYLYSRPNRTEPWMFGTLATAIEVNGGEAGRVKDWLNYCADVAEKDGNPNLLIAAADNLLYRGYVERVGPLLDATIAKLPHRGEPLRLMLLLARKTMDPDRMGFAAEKLLELGWPGSDGLVRKEVDLETNALVEALRKADRGAEADRLKKQVAEASRRDLVVRLTWVGDADLDLSVDEPLGATAEFQQPRTVFGGALIQNGLGKHPEEIYVCPRGFDGEYAIRVSALYNDPDHPIDRAKVEVTLHEGTDQEEKKTWTVSLKKPEPIVVQLKGGRRREVLPYTPPTEVPPSATAAPAPAPVGPRVRPGPVVRPQPSAPGTPTPGRPR